MEDNNEEILFGGFKKKITQEEGNNSNTAFHKTGSFLIKKN